MDIEMMKINWSEFVTNQKRPSPNVIRPIIFESWVRCREQKVDPYQKKVGKQIEGKEFEKLVEENSRLIECSVPFLDNLFQFVRESGFVISLTSSNGVILKMIGEEERLESIKRGNFTEGADWSEGSAGTNGIGTALFNKAPIQVFSYEHFCRCSQNSTCSSAPIRDCHYNVIGTITLAGDDSKVNSHTLGMVVAVANAIENCLKMKRVEEECRMANEYKNIILNSVFQGVLAIDETGNITHMNRIAKKILGLNDMRSWLGLNIFTILSEGNKQLFDIIRNYRLVSDEEINIHTASGNQKYMVTSISINSQIMKERKGMLLVLDDIKHATKMAHKISVPRAFMSFDDIVGSNKKFLDTVQTAKTAAVTDSIVLLLGESGTGKDIMAQAIHNSSRRKKEPFIALNCGAIPKELIGSELFGYEEGAFTGARRGGNIGKFEMAHHGTLFLDEIGDMPLDMQVHLLRVLEERYITRIGGNHIIPVDVRIIAATNKNLQEEVRKYHFRQDLYYRLNVIPIHMIPLRERKDDLPALIDYFYKKIVKPFEKNYYPVSEDFIEALSANDFPGNIRELQNIIERCVSLSKTGELKAKYLPEDIKQQKIEREEPGFSYKNIEEFEKECIYTLMKEHKGNISKVASEMNVARSTLYRKMEKYNIVKNIEMK